MSSEQINSYKISSMDYEEGGANNRNDTIEERPKHSSRKSCHRLGWGALITVVLLAVCGMLILVLNRESRWPLPTSESSSFQSNSETRRIERQRASETEGYKASIEMSGVRNDDSLQDCMSTQLKQTFPDIDYSLFGYNILKGFPLADGRDPGFTRPIFAFDFSAKRHTADCRYMLPHGLTAAPDVACTTSFESRVIENSVDLQESLDFNAHVSGGGWGVSFSASAGYKKATSEVANGKTKVIQSTANCKYYFTKIDRLDMPDYSPEVIEWFQRMDKSIDQTGTIDDNLIYSFIDYFGTHFPSEMVYGARYTYENRLSSSDFKTLSDESVSVEVQASYSGLFSVGGGLSMSTNQKEAAEKFQESAVTRTISVGAPPPPDGDAMTWASTVKETPVPVQYNLVPIYDLFSTEYTTKSYFSETNRRHIRDKLMRVASSYCRQLSDSGVDAACNDASVIKFVNVEPRSFDRHINNISLTECINSCKRRENCVVVTYHPLPHTTPSKCYLINLDKLTSSGEGGNMINCTNCDSFVIPRELKQPLPFQSFTYDSSVARRTKLRIRGNNDYAVLRTMCECACAYDSFCIGFEMTNITGYNYNCATYSTHSETLVPTRPFYFEAQLMSDLTKRNFLAHQIHTLWYSITIYEAKLQSAQRIGQEKANCDKDCCSKACQSNINCLASVAVIRSNSCKLIMERTASLSLVSSASEADSLRYTIFCERSSSGWFNVTGTHLTDESSKQMDSVQDCAKLCSHDVTCHAASWDASNSNCSIYDSSKWTSSTSTAGWNDNSAIMFPNNFERIKNFKLYD